MPWLASLLACFRSEPPAAPPPPPPEVHEAEVEVMAYREQDISKRLDHPKIHVYLTLALRGPSGLEPHARNGELMVNMRKDLLERLGPLPLTVGQRVQIRAVPSLSENYVQIRSFTAL